MKCSKKALFIVYCCFVLSSFSLFAGVEVDWVSKGGAIDEDQCNAVCEDANGYIYITGVYNPQSSFVGNGIVTSPSEPKVYVAKLNPDTGRFIWVKDAGGEIYNNSLDICVDSSGNIIVTGYCSLNSTFGEAGYVSATGIFNIFVAKLSSDGEWLWVTTCDTNNTDISNSVTADGSGNIYICGEFYNSMQLGDDTLTSAGGKDGFIAKLNSNGSWQWAKSFGGTNTDFGTAIVSDSSGNLYCTGQYYGQATFGSLGNITSSASYDSFVFKMNSSGQWQWVQSFGGDGADYAHAIDLNNQNQPCVAGYFNSNATFGALPAVTTVGHFDMFVASLNENGVWQWVETAGTDGATVSAYGLDVDERNNCYVTGTFTDTFQFSNLDPMVSNGYQDFYSARLDSNLNWRWSLSVGNTAADSGRDILSGSDGVYTVGYFQRDSTYFGKKRVDNYGHEDFYVMKTSVALENRLDYNSDGFSDLMWQNSDNKVVSCWYLDGLGNRDDSVQLANGLSNDTLVSTGDMNADGHTDMLFVQERDENNHYVEIWYNDGAEGISGKKAYRDIAKEWKFISVGDMNDDGYVDLIWQNTNSGRVVIWFLDSSGNMSESTTIVNWIDGWQLIDVADLNGDSLLDLVWQKVNQGSYQVAFWYLDRNYLRTGNAVVASIADTNWRMVGVEDYNNDGLKDFLWQHSITGKLVCWELDASYTRTDTLVLSGGIQRWRIASPAW